MLRSLPPLVLYTLLQAGLRSDWSLADVASLLTVLGRPSLIDGLEEATAMPRAVAVFISNVLGKPSSQSRGLSLRGLALLSRKLSAFHGQPFVGPRTKLVSCCGGVYEFGDGDAEASTDKSVVESTPSHPLSGVACAPQLSIVIKTPCMSGGEKQLWHSARPVAAVAT